MPIVYPTLQDVIAIHAGAMEATGVRPARLRDEALLQSALDSPRQLASLDPGADIVAQAIRLAVGISQAQAFVKGNKRAATGTADAFLDTNGIDFKGGLTVFGCWLILLAGDIHDDYLDNCVGHLGLDLCAEMDGLVTKKEGFEKAAGRREVVRRLDTWLRLNIVPTAPT